MKTEIRKEYWPNGNQHCEYSYVNGVPHGIQKYYYSNGQLSAEYNMKNFQWHGIRQAWIRDERRNYINQWKNNQRNGPEIYFKYKNL
jgi:antitoxin component YwqK of YwqJK toxin-antitoxin module